MHCNRLLFLFCLIFILIFPSIGAPTGLSEEEIKAAFIIKIASFVTWPGKTLKGSPTFNICTAGNQSLNNHLKNDARGETLFGKNILISKVGTFEEIKSCHIAYINYSNLQRTSKLLNDIRSSPILTIGEGVMFINSGGMIGFKKQENKIRFIINQKRSKSVGLKLSAKLLSLAIEP